MYPQLAVPVPDVPVTSVQVIPPPPVALVPDVPEVP